MANENSYKVPLFNGKNFGLWKKQIMVTLKTKGLSDALNQVEDSKRDEAWQKRDNEAQAILLGSMEQSVALKVFSCSTAADIWERLQEVYENTSVALVAKVFEEYYSYRKSPSDDMAMHISKVEALANHLETVGQKQTEVSIMSRLLHSLPASYSSLKEAWESVSSEKQTKATLVSRLLSHGATGEETSKDMALVANNYEPGSSNMKQNRRRPGKCYNCGKFGHWARECRSKPKETGDGIALVVGHQGGKSNQWVVDSGASQHICCRKEWFASMKPWDQRLEVANQGLVDAVGRGTVSMMCRVGNREEKVNLQDVLYIPSMTFNLFSTNQAGEKGAVTTLNNQGCWVAIQGKTILRGYPNPNGLICLDARVIESSVLFAAPKKTLHEWHRSLGHVDRQVIAEMAKNDCVRGMNVATPKEVDNCAICPEGKATRASHTMESSNDPKEVGDRVDMDLIGPISEESLGKKRYILLAKDSKSDYSHVFMINNKAEVAEKLQHYIGVFEAESTHRIRMINTDNGSEFCNHQVQTICDVEHIRLCFSAPYTPEQNGAAERNNRTIINTIRTLLADSRLPKALWAEAANTAVYIRNRTPKRGNDKTPYEIFWGRKPYVGHMVPFGTEVHSLINDRKLGKFDSRTEEGYVVGFTERSSNYRVLIKDSMKIKISSDVVFAPHSLRRGLKIDQEAEDHCAVISGGGENPNLLDEYFADLHQRMARDMSTVSLASGNKTKEAFMTATANSPNTSLEVESPSFSSITAVSAPQGSQISGPPLLSPRSTSLQSGGVERPTNSILSPFHGRSGSPPPRLEDSCLPRIDYPMMPFHSSPIRARPQPSSPRDSSRSYSEQRSPEPQPSTSQGHQTQGPPVESRTTQHSEPQSRLGVVTRSVAKQLGKLLIARNENMIDEPASYAQAVSGPNKNKWKEAIASELSAHETNHTWDVVKRPRNGTLLTTKWVFKIKRDENGDIDKFKARLVARGFEQQEGKDYTDVYAPVAKGESIRTLLAIACVKNLYIERFDVSTAFLHGTIDEEVYVEAPDGITLETQQCLKLRKALYGLKQAPKCWNSAFDTAVKNMGFISMRSDACVYRQPKLETLLSIYVDDGLILGTTKQRCLDVIEGLNRSFKTNRIQGEIFLGMQLQDKAAGLHISQKRYITDLIRRYNMEGCHGVDSPLVDTRTLFEKEGEIRNDVPYRAAIGGLLYTALCSRPDILYPTILLSRFNEEHYTKHWAAVKRILAYLKETSDVGLLYERKRDQITIEVHSDADWAGNVDNRRSTSGILIRLSGCPIVFASRQQTTVAQSSTEAELIAACEAVKELMWVLSFLDDLGMTYETPKLFIDNKSTIFMIRNNEIKRRSKHIDVKFHLVREKYQEGMFILEHVDSKSQLADFLTKSIGSKQLQELLEMSNVVSDNKVGIEGECQDSAIPPLCSHGTSRRSVPLRE